MVTVKKVIEMSNVHYIRVINKENGQEINTHNMPRWDIIEIVGDEEVKEIYNNERVPGTRYTWLDLYIK